MAICFHSKSAEFSWLSNFFRAPIRIDEQEYPTVEHWFQSQKFSDGLLQENIRLTPSPAMAKKLGRTRHASFRSDWDLVKEEIMLQGLRAKFTQHSDLRTRLLKTGSVNLQEQASWDSYWGSGRTGKGKNRMGHLLMKVRDELS